MQIKQISVSGLFGIFNHVIPLKTKERITIIHGLNGFGKTNILRILDGVFNSRYLVLKNIPFDTFKVEFDDDTTLEIVKKIHTSGKKNRNIKVTVNLYQPQLGTTSYIFKNLKLNRSDLDIPTRILEDIIPGLEQISIGRWRYAPTRERLSLDEVVERFESYIPSKIKYKDEPSWLKDLKSSVNIRLIESQRLLNINFRNQSKLRYGLSSVLPTVSVYSEELAELMQNKFTEYGKVSQLLDRTFPARAVKQQLSTDLTDQELKEQLNELEKTRSRLIELGLLDKDENPNFPIQTEDINEGARSILSVYVQDVEQKLSIFDEVANKLELLRKIINRKFAYSYKEMNFSKEKGFVLTTCYSNSLESYSKNLSPTDLSSGEQHELVLLYELLFKVEPNSLVLIDEPELSLHVGWQSKFLEDLKEITKLADLDILMATHSPDIIQDRWDDLTVELKAPGK